MQADDPAAIVDVPHFCAESGHALISTEESDGVQTYCIRKSG
jgi:tRNA 2-thiouridine synthesizing protein A